MKSLSFDKMESLRGNSGWGLFATFTCVSGLVAMSINPLLAIVVGESTVVSCAVAAASIVEEFA